MTIVRLRRENNALLKGVSATSLQLKDSNINPEKSQTCKGRNYLRNDIIQISCFTADEAKVKSSWINSYSQHSDCIEVLQDSSLCPDLRQQTTFTCKNALKHRCTT